MIGTNRLVLCSWQCELFFLNKGRQTTHKTIQNNSKFINRVKQTDGEGDFEHTESKAGLYFHFVECVSPNSHNKSSQLGSQNLLFVSLIQLDFEYMQFFYGFLSNLF